MGLITLVLIIAFSLLYLSNAMPNKAPALDKALGFIKENLNNFALAGLVFGLISLLITPLFYLRPLDMFARLFADFLLIVMSLPYTFDKLIAGHEAKINIAIMKELRRLMAWVTGHATIIGGAGAASAILLFATLFR